MAKGADQRRFPRAKERIPVVLRHHGDKSQFEATLYTADVSLTGAFFITEFYLKPGFELDLEFMMPNDDRPVRVKGVILREVRMDDSGSRSKGATVSGFAVRFTDYYADAKTVLASSFLSADLYDFVEDYLQRRTRKPRTEIEQLREVLIAWEVAKMELVGGELDLIRDRLKVDKEGRIRRH